MKNLSSIFKKIVPKLSSPNLLLSRQQQMQKISKNCHFSSYFCGSWVYDKKPWIGISYIPARRSSPSWIHHYYNLGELELKRG